MTWLPHATVAALVEENGRFLMVEELTEQGEVVYNQPAGHLEDQESLLQACIREMREETARGFKPEGLVGIYRWQVPPAGHTYLRFCFSGICFDYDAGQQLDDGILRALWMTREELMEKSNQLRSPMVMRCIDDYIAGNNHPLSILNDLS